MLPHSHCGCCSSLSSHRVCTGAANARYLFAFSTKDDMDKWLQLLASTQSKAQGPHRAPLSILLDAQATVDSEANASSCNFGGTLWMLGQCATPARGVEIS